MTFSEPLAPATVTADSVLLSTDGRNLPAAFELSPDGRTLTLTPSTPMPAPATVTVKLGITGNRLRDLAGNDLSLSESWTFTVPEWLPMGGPLSAYPGNTPAEDAVLKLANDGSAVVAWSESDGSTKNILVARWTGSTWQMLGSPLSGLSGLGTHAEHPALTIDAANRPVVAWDEATGDGAGRNLYVRRWTGATWEVLPAIPLTSGSEIFASHPAITVDLAGNLIVYANYTSTANSTLRGFNLGPSDTSWTDIHPNYPSHYFNVGLPAIVSCEAGIFASFSTYDDANSKRGIAVLKDHASPVGSSTSGSSAGASSIGVDGSGKPWIVWEQSSGNPLQDGAIYWAQWSGSAWSTPSLLSTGISASPSLAMGSNGAPILAWSGMDSSGRNIQLSRWTANTWQRLPHALNAVTGENTPAFNPSVTLDKNGQPLVAWTESDSSVTSGYVYRYNY